MAMVALYLIDLPVSCAPTMHGFSTMMSMQSISLIGGEENSPNYPGLIVVEYHLYYGWIRS